ncbi:MAG TPA: alpha/beta hydrolase [Microlunatus sp.]|nr:alpha/beta hydrolase [Microlunatus sp.]
MHGDPGLPDYLEPVHLAVPDGWRAHRYDQRGTGGSPWTGQHTMERHVSDLKLLLDAWGYDRAILVGHSFGTDLASFFLLAHPDRVAGVIFLCGPFLGPWREVTHATERSRRSDQEQARLEQLAAVGRRSDPEEIEFLTLSWQTDHADGQGARAWAHDAARTRRPVNYAMNRQLNRDKRRQPLESQVDRLKAVLPPGSAIIGGDGDPRPAASLRHLADRLGCDVTIILGAGHEPWLEQPAAFTTVLRSAIHGCAARLRVQHQRGCPSDGGDR